MTDSEIQKTAELIAIKVVEHFKMELPCKDNTEKINDHETIINDGLKDAVKNLRKWLWALIIILIGYGGYGAIDKIF